MIRYCLSDPKATIFFRHIEATYEDALFVTRWRNTEVSRNAFFCDDVVTPDSHLEFCRNRKLHDLVFMIHRDDTPIGMCSLTVDVKNRTAEYGRTVIDDTYKKMGYSTCAEIILLSYAFDFLRLDSLWGEVLESNVAVMGLHTKTGWVIDNTFERFCNKGKVIRILYNADMWKLNSERLIRDYSK